MMQEVKTKMGCNETSEKDTFQKRTYTVEEIMNILQIGKNSAYSLVSSGEFHCIKIGSQYRISKKSFDMWLDGLKGGEC